MVAHRFKCKHTGCPHQVTWRERDVPHIRKRDERLVELAEGKRQYLTCPDGHTYVYEIPARG